MTETAVVPASELRIVTAEEKQQPVKFGRDDVIACLSAIAAADINDYIEISGSSAVVRDIASLPPEKRTAIASVKNAAGGRGAEVHLYDRMKALDMLCRCLGMYSAEADDSEVLARLDEVLDSVCGQAE